MRIAKLVFDDGTIFQGNAFSGSGDSFGEVVFNTAMAGYQEVLTDPSYHKQIVLMTYPLIGNYGVNMEDFESSKIHLSGFIIKEYSQLVSNWRSTDSLASFLNKYNIIGAEGFDTRALTKFIRSGGAKKALLTTSTKPDNELIELVNQSDSIVGQDLVKFVSTDKAYDYAVPDEKKFNVAVVDCGVKHNILEHLKSIGCQCKVFPYTVAASDILDKGYDGLFISNGPGDPEPIKSVINLIRQCIGKIPLFGICLGQQLLALALDMKIYKLKFGHHGANHPIKNLNTGKIEITSQNHGFCVDQFSVGDDIRVTHMNLNDNTVAGIAHSKYPAFSVQYHPEAAPGPQDSHYLFNQFAEDMIVFKGGS